MLNRLGLGEFLWEMFRRPFLLIEAVRSYFAVRRRRRLTPARAYVSWRSYTAYGEDDAEFQSRDLIHYLAWRRRLRRSVQRVTAP